MDMTGDQVSNWELLKKNWKNYATANKLDQKDKKIVTATLLSIMGKECLHVCGNLPMTEEERQGADVIHTKLDKFLCVNEIRFMNGMYSTVVLRKPCEISS